MLSTVLDTYYFRQACWFVQRPATARWGAYYAHFRVYLHSVVITSEKCAEFIFTSLDRASSQFTLFLAGSDQFPTATWIVESSPMHDSFQLSSISHYFSVQYPSRCFLIRPDLSENRILKHPLAHFGDTISTSSSLKLGVRSLFEIVFHLIRDPITAHVTIEHFKWGYSKLRCTESLKYPQILKSECKNKKGIKNFFILITHWTDNILDILG